MKIEISVEEYKVVRSALVKRPFEEVAGIVMKLDRQVIEQSKAEAAEPQEKEERRNGD